MSPLQRGAAWMLIAAAAFAGMGVYVKAASAEVGPGQVVFFRSFASAAIVPWLALRGGESLRPVNVRMHLVRGTIGVASMFCYFTAIKRMRFLGDAVLITYLSPLLVAAIARTALGERPAPRVWGALLLGFAGVGLVVGPSGDFELGGTLAALASACFAAVAYVSISVLSRTDSTSAVVFWFAVIGLVLMAPTLSAGLPVGVVSELLVIGALGTLGQWGLTRAYSSAPASQVSLFAYATPVCAYLFGALALGEVPPLSTVVGVLVVVAAGSWAARSG